MGMKERLLVSSFQIYLGHTLSLSTSCSFLAHLLLGSSLYPGHWWSPAWNALSVPLFQTKASLSSFGSKSSLSFEPSLTLCPAWVSSCLDHPYKWSGDGPGGSWFCKLKKRLGVLRVKLEGLNMRVWFTSSMSQASCLSSLRLIPSSIKPVS